MLAAVVAVVVFLSYRQFSTVQSGQRDIWNKCEQTSDCVRVDEYCGAISSINGKYIEEHKKTFKNRVGNCEGKDFSAQKSMKPACVGGTCVLTP